MKYYVIEADEHKFNVDDIEELIHVYVLRDGTKVRQTEYKKQNCGKLTIESCPTFVPINSDDDAPHKLVKHELKFTIEYD